MDTEHIPNQESTGTLYESLDWVSIGILVDT